LIITQSAPDPDLAALAASFDPRVDTAALPRTGPSAEPAPEPRASSESKETSAVMPAEDDPKTVAEAPLLPVKATSSANAATMER
jgi:hypothetical protein